MSSVSRVLSGHPDVSSKMHQAVMNAVRDLGYQPDLLAQGLRSGRTFTVGFTVSDIANPVLAGIVTGAEKRLREAGYSLLLTNSEGRPELDVAHIELLERRRVDGLLLSLADEHHPDTVSVLRQARIPIVLIDRDRPPGVDAHCAAVDHGQGMRAGVEHLIKLGHRRLALISGGPKRPARERRKAIEDTLARVSGSAALAVYSGPFSVEQGRAATFEILAAEPRPTAIVAGGNVLMQGSLLALRDAGIRLGRDLSFVGCDDLVIAEVHEPPIAVVRRDTEAVGAAAAELLLGDLEQENPGREPREVLIPTEFIARASCQPPPV